MNTETERHIDKGLERQTDKTKKNKKAGINLYFADIFEEPEGTSSFKVRKKTSKKLFSQQALARRCCDDMDCNDADNEGTFWRKLLSAATKIKRPGHAGSVK